VALLVAVDRLYASASKVSEELTKPQALVLLAALAIEIWLSGDLTNEGDKWLPRHSRIALYGAYIAGVGAAVLLISPIRLPGEAVIRQQFSPETIPRFGILLLAMPLALSPAVVALRRASSSHTHLPHNASHRSVWARSARGVRTLAVAAVLIMVWAGGADIMMVVYGGPRVPNNWSTGWSPEDDFAISYPPHWRPWLVGGASIAAIDMASLDSPAPRLFVTVTPVVAPRPRRSPSTLAPREIVRSTRLPTGPAYVITDIRQDRTGSEYIEERYVIHRKGRIYVIGFVFAQQDAPALEPTFTKVARSLYFPT
jgi:hypothetical protein